MPLLHDHDHDQRKTVFVETPLLDEIDPERIDDDDYLMSLATECEDAIAQLKAQGADPEVIEAVSFAYSEALGIIPSDNFHIWIRTGAIDPEDPTSAWRNIDSPEYSDSEAVQALRAIRDDYTELFEETTELGARVEEMVKRSVRQAMSDGAGELTREEKIEFGILILKLGLNTSRIIRLLDSEVSPKTRSKHSTDDLALL